MADLHDAFRRTLSATPNGDGPPPLDDAGYLASVEAAVDVEADAAAQEYPSLPDWFWQARPALAHIRHAARHRLLAPDAVLGAVLARVTALTPPAWHLPPLVAAPSSLGLYIALDGIPGDGKSGVANVAAQLVPDVPAWCQVGVPLGSGEGTIEAFLELVDRDGGKGKHKRQTMKGIMFHLDEGRALLEMTGRKGSTLSTTLTSAWTGGTIGQHNATAETRRLLHAGSYVVSLLSAWQPAAAAVLIDDVALGLPQRFLWLPTWDLGADTDVDWPGPLDWEPLVDAEHGTQWEVAPSIAGRIRTSRQQRLRRDVTVEALDGHRDLARLKVAAALGNLDGRRSLTDDDWQLSEPLIDLSDTVRARIMAAAKWERRQRDDAADQRAARREHLIADTLDASRLRRAAAAIARRARRTGELLTVRTATHAMASRDRHEVAVEDAINEALRLEWLAPAEGGWLAGPARPA